MPKPQDLYLARTLDGVDVRGKRVLVRVDFNVPMQNGEVTDATRIERAAETLEELVGKGAQGRGAVAFRPAEGQARELDEPGAASSSRCRTRWAASTCASRRTASASSPHAVVDALPDGGMALLENLRFHAGEEKGDPAFADQLASLGDLYVNDAFSVSHRAHASVTGLAERLPAYAGRLMQAELEALEAAPGRGAAADRGA